MTVLSTPLTTVPAAVMLAGSTVSLGADQARRAWALLRQSLSTGRVMMTSFYLLDTTALCVRNLRQ